MKLRLLAASGVVALAMLASQAAAQSDQKPKVQMPDPGEFYRRTYLTESLRQLLVGAIRRLSGQGGDPVVQLQTNFGGGKTHSMLALYHLVSGTPPAELPGIEAVLQSAGVTAPPKVRPVVFVDKPCADPFAEIMLGHEKTGNRQVGFVNLGQIFVFITAKTF